MAIKITTTSETVYYVKRLITRKVLFRWYLMQENGHVMFPLSSIKSIEEGTPENL